MVARGEFWWYEPPDERPRPYLVMTRDPALPVLVRVLGVPTTRNVRGIPSELSVGPDDGLSTECVLTFDNLRLLWKPYLTRRITTLPVHRWPEVCAALLFTVAC